jgi:Spy/CpxP family protein refolding chaperone
MNRLRGIVVCALVAVFALGSLAFAQGQAGEWRGPRRGAGIAGPGVELRGVDLTDAQRDQIRDIVERYRQQMRTDTMLVLTPEQQAQVTQNEARREARMKERLQRLEQRRQQRQQNNN